MLIAASTPAAICWYCIRAQTKREHVAGTNLRERVGIEVFTPRVKGTYNTRRGLVMNATEALFPGYLFARFSYPDQLRHVLSTSGVTGIVAFGGNPPSVADDIIDCLRHEVSRAENATFAPVLEEGAWVRILSGCFQYIEGQVIQFDPRTERVRLLLSLLGSEVHVTVSAGRIALLSDSQQVYPAGLMAEPREARSHVRCAV